MSLHSTFLPVAHEDEDFIYILIQTLVIGLWPLSCKYYVYLWNGCNNDLCICVLHLKLWMLAMIQGLALQSHGSFSFTKEGSYSRPGNVVYSLYFVRVHVYASLRDDET